jgi:hypothetical protein
VRAWLQCGRRKKTAGWAVRVSWAGREAEAQWEGGGDGWLKRKGNGPWLGRKAGWAESDGKIPFRIKIKFLNIPRLWKFAQGDLGGILT